MSEEVLNQQEELELEKNIIWICSQARSGSTWLAKELLSYGTTYINEPGIVIHLAPLIGNPPKRRIDRRKNTPDYFFCDEYKKTWKYFLRKLILNRIYAQIGDVSKKVIIKEAANVDASDILSECLPNSRFIILVRDGRDVLDSELDGRMAKGWMSKQNAMTINKEQRFSFIKNHSFLWALSIESLMKTYNDHDKNSKAFVKYEDLRYDTLKELEKLYKFIDVEISKEKLEEIVNKYSFENIPDKNKGTGKFHRSATPGKWKESFNEEEKEVMEKIMGPTLKKLGF